MTEYWKSNAKHWCTACKVFIDGKKRTIRIHEEGRKHKENASTRLKQLSDDRVSAESEDSSVLSEIQKIEQAALRQYEADQRSESYRPDTIDHGPATYTQNLPPRHLAGPMPPSGPPPRSKTGGPTPPSGPPPPEVQARAKQAMAIGPTPPIGPPPPEALARRPVPPPGPPPAHTMAQRTHSSSLSGAPLRAVAASAAAFNDESGWFAPSPPPTTNQHNEADQESSNKEKAEDKDKDKDKDKDNGKDVAPGDDADDIEAEMEAAMRKKLQKGGSSSSSTDTTDTIRKNKTGDGDDIEAEMEAEMKKRLQKMKRKQGGDAAEEDRSPSPSSNLLQIPPPPPPQDGEDEEFPADADVFVRGERKRKDVPGDGTGEKEAESNPQTTDNDTARGDGLSRKQRKKLAKAVLATAAKNGSTAEEIAAAMAAAGLSGFGAKAENDELRATTGMGAWVIADKPLYKPHEIIIPEPKKMKAASAADGSEDEHSDNDANTGLKAEFGNSSLVTNRKKDEDDDESDGGEGGSKPVGFKKRTKKARNIRKK